MIKVNEKAICIIKINVIMGISHGTQDLQFLPGYIELLLKLSYI
jgi:hypothetical protein